MPRARVEYWTGVALWVSLFALAAVVSLQEIRTFDYWWHLRTGELIAETGQVPSTDPYTYTVPGSPWVDIHWLFQLGLYAVHGLGGHAGVVVAKTGLVLLLVGVLASIGRRSGRPAVSVVPLALMLLVACDRFMPRPELPTFLCLAGVLAVLDRHTRRGDAWVYAVVPIQLFWVNVHGLFALGIAICAIYLAAELLRPLLVPGSQLRIERLRRLAAVTLLAVLASLVNPNGLEGALYPVQQLGMIGAPEDRGVFGSLISELIPPIGSGALPPQALVPLFALAGLSFAAMALNWGRIHGSDPLLWVAFLYLALSAQRNGALFALVAAPIAARNLNEFLDSRRAGRPGWLRPGGVAIARLCAVALLLLASASAVRGGLFPLLGSSRVFGLGTMELFYPTGAVEWIARERPPGPIAHHMADGGYLIWRLYPDYRVMTDGRLEVFGQEKFVALQLNNPEHFRKLDAEYRFGAVLVHFSLVNFDALLWWLYLNSGWELVFVDDVAALFVRVPPGETPRYPPLDLDAPELFEPLGEPGVVDRMRRMSRTNFFSAMRRHERALKLWEETIALYPGMRQGDIVHATLLQRNGFAAAAEAILRRLLEEDPGDPILQVQIGDLRLDSGDLEAAKALYDGALEAEPNLPYALMRRGTLAESEGDSELAASLYMRAMARSHPASRLSRDAAVRLDRMGASPLQRVLEP